jgi:hypothetical protein
MKLSLVIGPVGVLMGLRFQGSNEAGEELMHAAAAKLKPFFCVFGDGNRLLSVGSNSSMWL